MDAEALVSPGVTTRPAALLETALPVLNSDYPVNPLVGNDILRSCRPPFYQGGRIAQSGRASLRNY